MAASLDDSGCWLPTHFSAGDQNVVSDAGLCFPTEFPYEVDSPVGSVLSSTETDGSDDDDFLAGLTRRFAQTSVHETQTRNKWVSGGSPQSTLSGIGCLSGRSAVSSNGSPNGTSQVSPPATPFGFSDDTWELIYAAAGEVARLKMSGEAAGLSSQQGRGLLGPPRSSNNTSFFSNRTAIHNPPQANQLHEFAKLEQGMKQSCPPVWARQVKASWATHLHPRHQQQLYIQNRVRNVVHENRACGPHSTWPQPQGQPQHHNPQPQAHRNVPGLGPVYPCATAAKRECTGTGVFLPRRYANPTEHRKQTGCTPVLVPAKVVQALNISFNDMNGHSQPRGVAPGHEAVLARRGALLMQQRGSMRASPAASEGHFGHEVRLPQEWTY